MLSTEGIGPKFKEVIERHDLKWISKVLSYAIENGATIFPKVENVFEAFKYRDFDSVRLVIIGQDPYKDERACGLAFASTKIAYSLANISKELSRTHSVEITDPSLRGLAKQGVLLLNAALTTSNKDISGVDHYRMWKSLIQSIIYEAEKRKIPIAILGKKGTSFLYSSVAYAFPHPSPQITTGPKFIGSDFFVHMDKLVGDPKIDWSASE